MKLLKQFMFFSIFLLIAFITNHIESACTVPTAQKRIWDYVLEDLDVDITTLSKVCNIESIVENVNFSGIDTILNIVNTIESYVVNIDNRAISIQSAVDNEQNCCSAINVIDTRTSSIYDIDQTIESKIDEIQLTVNDIDTKLAVLTGSNLDVFVSTFTTLIQVTTTLLSVIDVAASIAEEISDNLVSLEEILLTVSDEVATISSKIDLDIALDATILSKVMVIDTRTSSIYTTDQTILSYVANAQNCCSAINAIDTRTASIYNLDQTINSKVDALTALDQTTASKVGVIDTRTSSIYTTDQTILSYVANAQNCCSAINAIDTRTASIYNLDQTILSLVNDIDPRVISTQSTVNVIDTRTSSIYNLDQTINSKVDALTTLDQTTASKVGVIDTRTSSIYNTDQTILSYVANTQNCCSAINAIDTRTASIYNLDQTILSLVNDIDPRVISTQSTVNVIDTRTSSIYNLDQTINSKVDALTALDQTTASKVGVIDTRTSSIYNTDQTILSYVANAQNCCSAINAIDTRTASIFSLDQTIAANINSISSKVDVDIAIDRSTQSTVNVIDTRTSSIYSLDQVISSQISNLNTVNNASAIAAVQATVNNIFSIDQTIASTVNAISSKVDVDIALDRSTQSTVNVIDTRTSSIYNLDQTINSKVDVGINLDNQILSAVTTTTTANQAFVSIFGSQIAEGCLDSMSIQFQYGVTSAPVDIYTQGGGTVTSANSCAVLSTAGSAGSIAQVQSQTSNVYRSGHESYALFTAAFTGSFVATSSQLIGLYDYQNGYAVGFNGTTFGVLQRSNAANPNIIVDTFTPQTSFNMDKLDGTGPSGFVYVPSNLNVFRISFGWLGSAVVKFMIMNNNGNWITFHVINNPNTSANPTIAQPFLPITARVENIAGTSVLTLKTASWNAGIIASANTSSYRYNQANNSISLAGATEQHVLTIRNNSTFGSNNIPNQIQVRIAALGGGPIDNTNESATIRLRKNATVTGTTFTNVNSTSSVMSVSTAGTYTAGTGTIYLVQPVNTFSNGPNVNYIPKDTYEIILSPGDTATITATRNTAVTQTILCVVLWEERF